MELEREDHQQPMGGGGSMDLTRPAAERVLEFFNMGVA